jgi:aspartyl-tRNA(Asn)/glutamyl-tRNA(Gln) amidotransferase subunit A
MTLSQRKREFASKINRQAAVLQALENIADETGQGLATFLDTKANAPEIAAAMDREARDGRRLPPFAGLTVSIKDLFDVAGDVTMSGSKLLHNAAPATRDADAVHRLKQAGFIAIGRTNMTEFAFSGLGINPHYGTPLNPYDRGTGRIPGGSSSGAAISVSDGMCDVALGTDTGGSCRIPAALCGLVGFKPTAKRVSQNGVMPLSPTLDSIGSIGHSVDCCKLLDAVISGESNETPPVAANEKLEAAGIEIIDIDFPELLEIPSINGNGGFAAREDFLFHKPWIAAHRDEYDPRVLIRILKGEAQSDADYAALKKERTSLIERVARTTAKVDALVMPTTPLIAPALREVESDVDYGKINLLMLRNPTIANLLDGCSISLPCHVAGEAPVGMMLVAEHGQDHRLLRIAEKIEALLPSA